MTPDVLMKIATGYQASSMLRAGVQLDLFSQLTDGGASADAAATACGSDPRGTRILLDALAAIGVIQRDDETYRLTPAADDHLVPGRPGYLGGLIELFTSEPLWQGMRGLKSAVEVGGTVLESHAETPCNPFWESFARWTTGMARGAGSALAQQLASRAASKPKLRVLDVACGTGLYGYSIAEAYTQASVTSLDWPNVLEHSKKNAEATGVSDRVDYLAGDLFSVDIPRKYDVVVLANVFHHFDRPTCISLTRRMSEHLEPGGTLAVVDFISTGSPGDDPFPHIFSSMMLVWTRRGEAYARSDYGRFFEEAGLSTSPVVAVPQSDLRILFGDKPASAQ